MLFDTQKITNNDLLKIALSQLKVRLYQTIDGREIVIKERGVIERFSQKSIKVDGEYYFRSSNLFIDIL